MSQAHFILFSDGGSYNNGFKQGKDKPQLCSIGICITLNENVLYEGSKGFEGDNATISFAEINGAFTAVKALDKMISKLKTKPNKPYKVTIVSDSQLVVKGINEWVWNWVNRDWKNAVGTDVGQCQLWKDFFYTYLDNEDWDIDAFHVKGHTKNEDYYSIMNDKCDKLAVDKIKEMKEERGIE